MIGLKSDEAVVKELLSVAGIVVNGNNPWDIKVHSPDVYHRVLARGNLGLGETYMDGLWDADDLGRFFSHLLAGDIKRKVIKIPRVLLYGAPYFAPYYLSGMLFNLQKWRPYFIGKAHYDTGNRLFEKTLGENMCYSCAYWDGDVDTLEEAQQAKMRLIGDKLHLKPGMHVLDIGCGFGSLAMHLAREHGVSVTGITVSEEQCEWVERKAQGSNLPVKFLLEDYRKTRMPGPFDRIVSVGMFEHVGVKNYKTFIFLNFSIVLIFIPTIIRPCF